MNNDFKVSSHLNYFARNLNTHESSQIEIRITHLNIRDVFCRANCTKAAHFYIVVIICNGL